MEPLSNNIKYNSMDQIPGKLGLVFLGLGGIFNFIHKIHQADVTFVLGTVALILTIVYYIIQIFKPNKK